MENENEIIGVPGIGNYYGGLDLKEENGKYYWSIQDWDGHDFKEIPKYLFDALIQFINSEPQDNE